MSLRSRLAAFATQLNRRSGAFTTQDLRRSGLSIRWGTTLHAMRSSARLTSCLLTALAVLHAAWGLGSAFPFRSRTELADAVVGSSVVPPPMACFAVAGALATGTALVADVMPLPVPFAARHSLAWPLSS